MIGLQLPWPVGEKEVHRVDGIDTHDPRMLLQLRLRSGERSETARGLVGIALVLVM